jgi:hypothetical protein
MQDGRLYVLSQWQVGPAGRTVAGSGELLDQNRRVIQSGEFSVDIDSVAVFETNIVQTSPAVAALAVISGASVALTIVCIANPKACFGSCPTFYVSDGEKELLQAEGFSSSVSPSMEAQDIDALYRAGIQGRTVEVRMTNEALETHVVRSVNLLAIPRAEGERVFLATDGAFWSANEFLEPARATAEEGDCLEMLRRFDGIERYSSVDSTDLTARELIELEFPAVAEGRWGLVVASRQTLLSTFLFYQALAYLGESAVEAIAEIERGDAAILERSQGFRDLLGGIEVLVPDAEGSWTMVEDLHETGPLASDVRLVPLTDTGPGPVRVRLRLTRGHWRLDYVAMVRLTDRVQPNRRQPIRVYRGQVEDGIAHAALLDSTKVLTTLPGDEYVMVYELPDHANTCELFLDSQGYYLEWIRQEWLVEENPAMATMMFLDTRRALRELAPQFKELEAGMEEMFWRSRYVSP